MVQEELEVGKIGHDAMMKQEAVQDENIVENGFHQGWLDTHEHKTCSRQSRSNLSGRVNSNNSLSDGRKEPLVEFFRGAEPG